MNYYIGTSGYHYNDWKGEFYPEELKKDEWLSFYAKHFHTLEINNTFYKVPAKETFERWKEATPSKFKFTVKGSRYATHMKKLNDPEKTTKNFYKAIEPLAEKIDCVLWQLPGNQHFDKEKLVNFGKACSKDFINVLEFRHESWFTDECYDILSQHNLAYCMISAPDPQLPEIAKKTIGTGYLRFHGKGSSWYDYLYSKNELKKWIKKLEEVKPARVFVYFNNDMHTNAIQNARQMKEMLS